MNKTWLLVVPLYVCSLWACLLSPAGADEADTVLAASLVTKAVLESKIAATEAATGLDEGAKARLVELYRKALSNLEQARSNEESAEAFQGTAESAPAQIRAIRASLEPDARPEPLTSLDADASTPLQTLEQLWQKEQADLTAVDARRADFESRLTIMEQRPAAISQRLMEATQQREAVSVQLQTPAAEGVSPALAQATRWALETRYLALSTEVKMLDQELLSRPLRMQLLTAKRDKEQASVQWIGARVQLLSDLIDRKRQQAAEQAKTLAEQTQRENEGMDQVLVDLSEQNAALSSAVSTMTKRLNAQELQLQRVDKLAGQIGADYKDARETLESGEISGNLGRMLLQQREALPDPKTFRRAAEMRRAEIAELNAQRLGYRAEARRIADADATVDTLAAELQAAPTGGPSFEDQKARLRELVQQRQGLLDSALEANQRYLGTLRELDRAEQVLLATTTEYNGFLREQLPWLRSAQPIQLQDILALPSEVGTLLAAADVPALLRLVAAQLARDVGFWLALIAAAALRWQRRSLIRAIEAIAIKVGKPTTDRMSHTGKVILLTLLIAAPLPLVLTAAGWQLQFANDATALSSALGDTLTRVALHLAILLSLRAVCLPRGLAAVHFRWPERNLALLRTQLAWLTWLFVSAVLIIHLTMDLDPTETGGTLAKLALLVGYSGLSWFLYRVLHPQRGVLAQVRSSDAYPLLARTYLLWYPLAIGYPLYLVALAFSGYIFAATADSYNLLHTLWFCLGLTLANALALRWLQVTRRRLAFDAAMERRRAAQEAAQAQESAGEVGELQFEAPEVDITALSDDTRRLIRVLVLAATAIGLYLIWSNFLPALRVFDDVVLWHETVTVDGIEQSLPITLGSLALALFYAVSTWLLATRLPALLEILLLQRFKTTAAGRYTVITLMTYVIVAAGIVLVLATLGARWSQLQWLAAALSVGIGFGLQEIVANFISGVIILFERPIRVGDAVTVGDTDGIVTKIKIRATTIRNWDGKELLVPNKEFITGRLLNWSLSDQTTRLVLSVGIAYGSDVRRAMTLLEEAAKENENVLDDPAPTVIFETFGDNALGLLLRCFVDSVDLRVSTLSALNEAINAKFNAAGISIAFPQRDLHLDTISPLRIQIEGKTSRSQP